MGAGATAGWPQVASTDLVQNGYAAINALGDAVAITNYATALRAGAVQSIPNAAYTALTFDTEQLDPMGGHAGSGSTITPTKPGLYLVMASVVFAANATGRRFIKL